MSSSTSVVRVSQRQPKACKECTRRKIRCDKKVPCSRCVRLSKTCLREVVRISTANTLHRDELEFLAQLRETLEASRNVDDAISCIRQRQAHLVHGSSVTTSSTTTDLSQPRDSAAAASPTPGTAFSPSSLPPFENEASPGNANGVSQEILLSSESPQLTDTANSPNQHASRVKTVEFLAWGRHSGSCFPHRSCQCRSIRPYAEITSINTDPGWAGIQRTSAEIPLSTWIPAEKARALIQLHFDHILWHHSVFHAPTFLAQCEDFWTSGLVTHPLWKALYLSVITVTLWTVINSDHLQQQFDVNEILVGQHFDAMLQTLFEENFLENLSLYSIQAIALSTRVAHSLGRSDLNATLLGASIRIAHCMGLHEIEEPEPLSMSTDEDWYQTVEAQVGRRCWLQMIIQDYFQIPFTNTYVIHPPQCTTTMPRNCHDHDMTLHGDQIPTITSYVRVLSQIARLMPRLLDGLGSSNTQTSLLEVYKHVISSDMAFRSLMQKVPSFLMRESQSPDEEAWPVWVPLARRSLAISAADKIIMIHRPILFHSFQIPEFSRTRKTCLAAAKAILREHEAGVNTENSISLWTHSAFCVTAAMVIGLELFFHENHIDEEARDLRACLSQTAQHLKSRNCDIIAERGAALIDTLLSIEEELVLKVMRLSLGESAVKKTQIDVVNELIENNEIVAKFLSFQPARKGSTSYQQNLEDMNGYLNLDFTDAAFIANDIGGMDSVFSNFSGWNVDTPWFL